MIRCTACNGEMRCEDRPTWTRFKTLVCTTCERAAYIASFAKRP